MRAHPKQSVKQLRTRNRRAISAVFKSTKFIKEIIAHGNGRLEISTVIERVARGNAEYTPLSGILAMECFPIRRADAGAGHAVAATSNIRNPVYLLAKLKCPNAYDDPKFLPLIPGSGPTDSAIAAPHLFYHYRQFVIESRGATNRVTMQGTNLLCICDRQYAEFLPGRRIW